MCHNPLNDPRFFTLLLQIDRDLAATTQAQGCRCGGVLHRANFPRKPRGCPREARPQCATRFSFCCADCRRRRTAPSVRFMGRRVYLMLAMVLASSRLPTRGRCDLLPCVSRHTLMRWRRWWQEQFCSSALWRAGQARFMPPVPREAQPTSLLQRFCGGPIRQVLRLLLFLCPLSQPA